ncbi:integral membrane protein [Colletotrichum cereale]|nr:integral membrane protein [Colletotrichum cereale]
MEDRSGQVLAVAVLFFVLSWIAVGLRIYCRGWIIRSLGVDDKLMIGLMLIYTVYLITQIQGVRYGTGRHRIDLSPEDNRDALMYWYICELLYIISTCLLKISVGYFLLRVSICRSHIWILRLLMLGTVLFGTTYFFMVMFQCTPIPTYWEQSPRVEGKCFSNRVVLIMTYTASIINCLADWAFGILPLFILWSLSLPKRTRILAFAILSFAAIGSVATVIRSVYIPTLLDGDDFLWSTTDIALWSTVEPGIGIMAASIATLRPLWQLIGYRSGLRSQAPRAIAWRERFQAKPSYVRSDGSDPRQDPLDTMPNGASPEENEAETRSVFQPELPPIRISENRFSLSTTSRRSRLSKTFDMSPPADDKRIEGKRRSAENVLSDDVESLVTPRKDSDGSQWLCPSPPRDRDDGDNDDYEFEAEDGFNLMLMTTTTHGAPTINWSSPRMSTISLGFGPSNRDSGHSAAPSWGFSKCNGASRVSRISGSALNYSNSIRASRASGRSNIMHSNSIRANSIRASRLSSVSDANEARDGGIEADSYARTPATSRDASPSPSPSPHSGSRLGRQGRTPPRASGHSAVGSQFLSLPSLDFQMPSPPPNAWRGSAAARDTTDSAQWLSSRMAEYPPESPSPRRW